MPAIVIKNFTNARCKNAPGLVFISCWGWPTLDGISHGRGWRIRHLTRWHVCILLDGRHWCWCVHCTRRCSSYPLVFVRSSYPFVFVRSSYSSVFMCSLYPGVRVFVVPVGVRAFIIPVGVCVLVCTRSCSCVRRTRRYSCIWLMLVHSS